MVGWERFKYSSATISQSQSKIHGKNREQVPKQGLVDKENRIQISIQIHSPTQAEYQNGSYKSNSV